MSLEDSGFSIGDAVRLVLPQGTLPGLEDELGDIRELFEDENFLWLHPPLSPADLFAVCAYIIQSSGLMGFFDPNPAGKLVFDPGERICVFLSDQTREDCEEFGQAWRDDEDAYPHPKIVEMWEELVANWRLPIRAYAYQAFHARQAVPGPCPNWWSIVLALLISADEASSEPLGAFSDPQRAKAWDLEQVRVRQYTRGENSNGPDDSHTQNGLSKGIKGEASYTSIADPMILSVQPKLRVSQLGSTLRNLSHNLAASGPVGSVRSSLKVMMDQPKHEDDEGLDILLVPMPYELNANDFEAMHINSPHKHSWGNFRLKQSWLPIKSKKLNNNQKKNEIDSTKLDSFLSYIQGLVENASKDVGFVNAIIFPELALTYDVFELMVLHIKTNFPKIEFIVAGSSDNCFDESGNFLLTAIWDKNPIVGGEDILYITSQGKHHRWKLDSTQIRYYGLTSILHPGRMWWEDFSIGQRELAFYQFRQGSVFCALICEDLARSEPVHELLRSVAPNIVFALLMDGPQIIPRWPARYASALADDPGSSVLTFTSFALVKRANETSGWKPSRSIALWKDESGVQKEIEIEKGAGAVLLSLTGAPRTDRSIDNRVRSNKYSWGFGSMKSIYP
jgi:hypothetical protein